MFESIESFKICSKITEELKTKIKLFNVFNDYKGYNVLFATTEDEVYGFGQNYKSCCGLGHDSDVHRPQLIPELCYKSVKQLFIGFNFYLAITEENQLFGWGENDLGQLATGKTSLFGVYLKPQLIAFPLIETIVQISCGSVHCLALTSEGDVYGWGRNNLGQVGCGAGDGDVILRPTKLDYFSNSLIKYIYCLYESSFAITNDGKVFSWGCNPSVDGFLGLELPRNEKVFTPKQIKFEDFQSISSICCSNTNTYFLTTKGLIYFCGKFIDENYYKFQTTPKLITTDIRFKSFHSTHDYMCGNMKSVPTVVNESSVFVFDFNEIKETNYKTFFDFYSIEYRMTYKTIDITEESPEKGSTVKSMSYKRDFDEIQSLGSGGYGTVFKVRHKTSSKFYAIKKVHFSGK